MRINNPRFTPEDLFTEKYWGELKPPTESHYASYAPRRERKALSLLLGEVLLPILQGRIRGTVLSDGAAYDPTDPNLSDLPQHFPGTVLLIDRERLHRSKKDDEMLNPKSLPLEDADELRLHLPSRQFVRPQDEDGVLHSKFLHIQHNDMLYVRTVRVEAIALQAKTKVPVAYTPMPFPLDEATQSVPVYRLSAGPVGNRIGSSYVGNNGGIWRTTMVEICQEGVPAEVPIESIAFLGQLATE